MVPRSGIRGSIRPRGADRWQLRVYAGMVQGKPRYLTRTIHGTRKEAQDALAVMVASVVQGKARAAPRGTVAELLEQWYLVGCPRWSPATQKHHRETVDTHLAPGLGHVRLAKLTRLQVEVFLASLATRGLAPITVRGIHNILKSALYKAMDWDLLVANPARKADRRRVPKRTPTSPGPEILSRLLNAPRDPDHRVFLWVAIATGARRGELLGLQWREVDLDNARLRICRRVVGGPEGEAVYDGTKGGQPGRWIYLDPDTVDVLRDHRDRMVDRAAAFDSPLAPSSFLFSGDPLGRTPWRLGTVSNWFGRLASRVGAPGVRLNDLRHAHTTEMLDAGVDLKTVSERVGHDDAAMTLRVYTHPDEESHRRAAAMVGKLMAGWTRAS